MNRGCFSVVFPLVFSLITLSGPAFVFASSTQVSGTETTDISLITPVPDTEIIAKRPEIICRVDTFDTFENVMIFFDGADVTGIIHIAPDGFSFRPVELLPPGMHTLTVLPPFFMVFRQIEPFQQKRPNVVITSKYPGPSLVSPKNMANHPSSLKIQIADAVIANKNK